MCNNVAVAVMQNHQELTVRRDGFQHDHRYPDYALSFGVQPQDLYVGDTATVELKLFTFKTGEPLPSGTSNVTLTVDGFIGPPQFLLLARCLDRVRMGCFDRESCTVRKGCLDRVCMALLCIFCVYPVRGYPCTPLLLHL